MIPGEILHGEDPVPLNAGREPLVLIVANTGDRPVQVGSHFHFAQANAALRFDRDAAWGHRLNIAAGTAVRFEPGVEREVSLVPLAGRRVVPGLQIGGRRLSGPAGAVHDVRVAGLADRGDPAVPDAYVRLDDAPVVEDDRAGDDEVRRALRPGGDRLGVVQLEPACLALPGEPCRHVDEKPLLLMRGDQHVSTITPSVTPSVTPA